MDKIIIKDLCVCAIIGVYDHERHHEQNIIINVELFTDLSKAGQSDEIYDTVDYDTLIKKIEAHTRSIQRFTLEALAGDIADICLNEPSSQQVRVRIEKPGAVPSARSVGVEINRHS